jgi:Tfp pilus assembly protein PilF
MSRSETVVETKPQELSAVGFLDEFMRIHEQMEDRLFAFILGAGASVTSGIPAGGALVWKWLEELRRLAVGDDDSLTLETWATEENLGIPSFSLEEAASFYPQVYDRRFGRDPEVGYAYLENVMSRAEPSIGYSILATVLAETRHRVVITTNFDNLVADALSIFTDTFPLVCGHESLAGFARVRLRRPLVAKIHRDVLLAPRSDAAGTAKLGSPWKDVLGKLLGEYTPVVIGYGGNDGGLMGFLESLEPGDIRGGIHWCYRSQDGRPNGRICSLVAKHSGGLVPIVGFDEFMIQLGERFGYKLLDKEIESRASARAKRYREQFEKFQSNLAQDKHDPDAEEAAKPVREALAATVARQGSWWSWELRARAESDPEKRERIYRRGLEEFPDSAELTGNFASFMTDIRKDHDEAERLYRRALELDPENAINTSNFASFMTDIRKDHDEAERLYRRALELDPGNATDTGNFAVFMTSIRKDHGEAERLHRRALELDPENATNTGNFANFMTHIRRDHDEAERLYRRGLELDPVNAYSTGNFAGFLLAQSRFDECRQVLPRGWSLARDDGGQVLGEVLLYWCLVTRAEARDDTPGLGRLKALLQAGFVRLTWSFADVLAAVEPRLSADDKRLYSALAGAILDDAKVCELDQFGRWTEIEPIPLDEPWDMSC